MPTTPRRPRRTARTADKHELYQLAVQAPEVDAPFLRRYFTRLVGRAPCSLREDFCGTALLAAHWVAMRREHRAIGVDFDQATLDWGRRHNVDGKLDDEQRSRLQLLHADVRTVHAPPVDLIVAFNFSYSLFMTRDALRAYFAHVRKGLVRDGLFVIDAWGGSETLDEREERRRVEDFTYCWEQARFDPITHHSECRIHFRFMDGTVMRNAFCYHWRLWILPELLELLGEAGFRDVHVLWEGTDRKTNQGNSRYRRVKRGEADPAWVGYVVGRA